METNFKKLLPLAGMLFSCISGFADNQQMQQPSSGNSGMMNRASIDDGTYREITPNAGPRVQNGADVYLTADFIYWTAREDGLGYARTGVTGASTSNSTGHTSHVDGKFSPGFKVGAGLDLGHDGWDIYLGYTWFHTHPSSTSSAKGSSVYTPLWDVGGPGYLIPSDDNFTTAKGSWALRFNNFDLELGRNYYISQYLTLRPSFGFKGTWQNQNYHVKYSNFASTSAYTADTLKMKATQDYWGVGVRSGLDTSWFFDKNWSIYGDMALSALWGRFNVSRKDKTVVNDSGDTTVTVNTADTFHTVKPVLELAMGLRYDYWFSDDDYHFGLQAGWEEQIWINQNQFFRTDEDSVSRGDLSFQGLSIRLRFDF